MDEPPNNARYIREWILFSICVGLGGHVALGLLLHAPESWTMAQVAWTGLLISLAFYFLIQIGQSIWRRWGVEKSKKVRAKPS